MKKNGFVWKGKVLSMKKGGLFGCLLAMLFCFSIVLPTTAMAADDSYVTIDGKGATQSTAIETESGQMYYRSSGWSNVWNKVTLEEDGYILVSAQLSKYYADIYVYDENNSVVFEEDYLDDEGGHAHIGLKAGTYYVRFANEYSGNSLVYCVTVFSGVPGELEPNDTFSTATSLSLNKRYLCASTGFSGSSWEDEDYYSVNLKAGETYRIFYEGYEDLKPSVFRIYEADRSTYKFVSMKYDASLDAYAYDFDCQETGVHYIYIDLYGPKEGTTYILEVQHVKKPGWLEEDGNWYYVKTDGSMATSEWVEVSGSRYHFGADGVMDTGWYEEDGKRYYLKKSGAMACDQWGTVQGERYHFGADGVMDTGWLKDGGKWYYLKASGAMASSEWVEIEGVRYHFGADGVMDTGWLKDGGNWYYLKKSGAMACDQWGTVKGERYHFGADGVMDTGWYEEDGKRYYLKKSGAMACDQWGTVQGERYHFGADGVMDTGWLKDGGKWYYLKASGAMASSEWVKVSGSWYYFNGSGVMQTSKWIGNYYVGANGKMATSQWVGKYYVGADGKWIPGYGSVYWVPNGSVYHVSDGCPSLHDSDVIKSGSVSQAKAAGKDRVCKVCG